MKPRALIVDDERAECEMFADALRDAGFDPAWELEPSRALELVETQAFDVVVTDLKMPGMSGSELCRQIKQVRPNLPVVVVTAFGSIDAAVTAMRAGAYDFVTKPFDVDTIGLVLQRAVENHELRTELDALRRVISELLPLEEVERRYIACVIEACAGNKSKAARILGIGRKTLYRHLGSLASAAEDEEKSPS